MDSKVIDARIRAVHNYIQSFLEDIKESDDIVPDIEIDSAAENICDLYFRYAEEVIRPSLLSEVIQNYKIVAFTEFSVLRVQPLDIPGNLLKTAEYNAKLAFHIALSILMEWNDIDPNEFRALTERDKDVRAFIKEHLDWMTTLDSRYYFPGFSNSQIWRLFHYVIIDRIKPL